MPRELWAVGDTLDEERAFGRLGGLARKLADGSELLIDFSRTIWADAAALLNLTCTLASFSQSRAQIVTNFGDFDKSPLQHKIFMKFAATQGFLDLFNTHTVLYFGRRQFTLEMDFADYKHRIASHAQATLLRNADCIKAQLLPCIAFENRREDFRSKVDELVREAKVRTIDAAFGSSNEAKDQLFVKLRRLLHELLANSVLHAYRDEVHGTSFNGYAGVYARIHGRRPPYGPARDQWQNTLSRELSVPAIRPFAPNVDADWLELFICDSGVGLLHDLERWAETTDSDELRKRCARAAKATRRLYSFAPSLFIDAFSNEKVRHQDGTAATGLVHLNQVLSQDGDFSRIYTEGAFLGSKHPWTGRFRQGGQKLAKTVARSSPALGTSFVVELQPSIQIASSNDDWLAPTELTLDAIRNQLIEHAGYVAAPQLAIFDLTEALDAEPPEALTIDNQATHAIVRLPSHTSKNNILAWLDQWGGIDPDEPRWGVKNLIVTDVTQFEASPWIDVAKTKQFSKTIDIRLFFLTTDWQVCFLQKKIGDDRLSVVRSTQIDFEGGRLAINLPLIALALRHYDSIAFWHEAEGGDAGDVLIREKIIWHRGGDEVPILIDGYLDVAHAISLPRCQSACQRATKRAIALWPEARLVASDDIIRTLLATDDLSRLAVRNRKASAALAIGSVCITGGTLERQSRRSVNTHSFRASLFVHPSSEMTNEVLPILSWLPINHELPSDATPTLPYERIPFTPFVGRDGERSLRVNRYIYDELNPFQHLFSERSTQQAYSDFEQDNLLKLGHWQYGTRHELLTVNLARALSLSVVDHGDLVRWLTSTIERLLVGSEDGSTEGAAVIVYPSHDLTDRMIHYLRRLPQMRGKLRPDNVIPVRSLGVSTVSPIKVSPTTRDKIRRAIAGSPSLTSAIILDDGVVTGKHIRELTALLQNCGAGRVHTVALIDRSGTQPYPGNGEYDAGSACRFWKWDVPALGHQRDCILCASIALVRHFLSSSSFPTHRARLREWIASWQTRDVGTDWQTHGVMPVAFAPPIGTTFGLFRNSSGEIEKSSVSCSESTSLASLLLELSRETTKAEVVLRKAAKLSDDGSIDIETRNNAAIEMVATQFLLFYDELNFWQKLDRLKFLFSCAWQKERHDPMTALVGLCICVAEVELIEAIILQVAMPAMEREEARQIDSVLLVSIMFQRLGIEHTHKLTLSERSSIAKRNLFLAGATPDPKEIVRTVFEVIGDSPGAAHHSRLRRALLELSGATSNEEIVRLRLRQEILFEINRLHQALSRLGDAAPVTDLPSLVDATGSLLQLAESLSTAPVAEVAARSEGILAFIYGVDGKVALSGQLWNALVLELAPSTPVLKLLDVPIGELQARWARVVEEKRTILCRERWTSSRTLLRPAIRYGGSVVEWPFRCPVYFDSAVRSVISDALSNVVHSQKAIPNPWRPQEAEYLADLWWKAEIHSDHLLLVLVNATTNETFALGDRLAMASLERVGGAIEAKVEGGVATTFAKVPRLRSMRQGGEP